MSYDTVHYEIMECSKNCDDCMDNQDLMVWCECSADCINMPKFEHETKAPDPEENLFGRWTVENLIDALYKLPSEAEVLITPGGNDMPSQFIEGVTLKVWRDGTPVVYIEGEDLYSDD